jgi:transposase
MSSLPTSSPEVVLGIDSHRDTIVCAALDGLGRRLAVQTFPTTAPGYVALLRWAQALGSVRAAGVEGTATYGAGAMQCLRAAGVTVMEVNRPNRARRRRLGKSDVTDAENAARAVLAGDAEAVPKAQDGVVEALRTLLVARRGAVKARTQSANQLRALLVTAAPSERERLGRGTLASSVARCARLAPTDTDVLASARRRALRALARRWQQLTRELYELDAAIAPLVHVAAPRLLTRFGVGPLTAATLLITAGDNPERLRSEAALAALCGASPVEASSGRTSRHRLNRGGDRQANNALWTVALVRMRSDPRTRAYAERRQAEGRSRKEIVRCLKRYLVRELFPLIIADVRALREPCLT